MEVGKRDGGRERQRETGSPTYRIWSVYCNPSCSMYVYSLHVHELYLYAINVLINLYCTLTELLH